MFRFRRRQPPFRQETVSIKKEKCWIRPSGGGFPTLCFPSSSDCLPIVSMIFLSLASLNDLLVSVAGYCEGNIVFSLSEY